MSSRLQHWRIWIPRPAKFLRLRNWRRAILYSFLGFLALDLLHPLPDHKPYSPEVLARDGSLLRAFLSPDQKWRMDVKLNEVPSELPAALIAKEDRYFYYHPGVNPLAIGRAIWGNITSRGRSSGASTITMQVARMLEPKARSLPNKVMEAFRAFQLEWHHTKPEILEMYLSYLPYGGNIEGVKAASYLYFERPPSKLSLAQCMLLTVIPNRPNSLRPDMANPSALQARNKWLRRFAEERIFPTHQLQDAIAEPMPTGRHEIAYLAPHFCRQVQSESQATQIATTLNPRLQALSQDLLANHVGRLKGQGISNGAVLVIDNRTMEVMAYCGSADFENKTLQGEVDAIQAVRSPGSTLKPFIYAMAFDQGILTPHMKLLDIPTEFSDFLPVNYDRNFRGEVDAADALRYSLNLPAVRLLNQVGLKRFIGALVQAGFRSIDRHSEDLGLSVALGGCGARLEELVRSYAALANGGMMRPLRMRLDAAPTGQGQRVCSAAAAYMISEILSNIERPDLPDAFMDRSKLPKIAWKTGTSFGRRDAWSIGFNPRYTIGVWMGNMDGKPVLEMSGGKTAVPLMLELFNAIDYDSKKEWLKAPAAVGVRMVCVDSGQLPHADCEHLRQDYFIPGTSSERQCQRFRTIFTNLEGNIQYCKSCLPAQNYISQKYPVVSSELALWMEKNNIHYEKPPLHNPNCMGIFAGPGPVIYSPAKNKTYLVEEGQRLMLQASPDPSIQRHYWFADKQYLGECQAGGKFFFEPRAGNIAITCMDDKGRKGEIHVRVEMI